jgi:hypothetical protein
MRFRRGFQSNTANDWTRPGQIEDPMVFLISDVILMLVPLSFL